MKILKAILIPGIITLIAATGINCKSSTSTNHNETETIAIDTDIVYYKALEKDLMLDLYWYDQTDEKFPLIVWIHGGAGFREQNDKVEAFFNKHLKK